MFKAMWADGVIWADGREEAGDAIIFATGFRPDRPFLPAGVAVDGAGRLRQRRGASTTIDGLYFVGQPGLTRFASGVLRGVGHDAAAAVRRITRRLAACAWRGLPPLWRRGPTGRSRCFRSSPGDPSSTPFRCYPCRWGANGAGLSGQASCREE